MSSVFGGFVGRYDMMPIGAALAICLLASFSSVSLADHARRSEGRIRTLWLSVVACAGGVGIWGTHFVAMLAFEPGLPSGYAVTPTIFSLISAILFTGAGFSIALRGSRRRDRLLGGGVLGVGVAAMHFGGMAAFEVAGQVTWNGGLVAASIVFGIVLGAIALGVGQSGWRHHQALSAVILSAAICAVHFTAMAALEIHPDSTVEVSAHALKASMLAVPGAMASVLVFFFSLLGLAADVWSRRRALVEATRMRALADAAVEGLLICDGETIVTMNTSFAALTGFASAELAGQPLSRCIPERDVIDRLLQSPNQVIEANLRTRGGEAVPVELIVHDISFVGKSHHAVAVRDLRSRKIAAERIRFLAHHDVLTGLPNRSWFHAELDRAIVAGTSAGRSFAVLCLNLDRFKEVNDLFGQPAGDEVLRCVARIMSRVLAAPQVAARLGGDEFAILVPGISDAPLAGRLADAILTAVSQHNAEAGSGPVIAASIGIAIFPNDGAARQELLSAADTALYRAKVEGRGTYCFYEPGMGAQVRDRRRLEHDMRCAIGRGEMTLAYQPQMDVETGTLVGFEALLRWCHPERGMISPAVFIPIAEEGGAILRIGEWVLREACAEAATWANPLRVAVNVSAVQLHGAGFAQFVETVLDETGLDPHRLELEVTETALIRDINRALETLGRLKALGVLIAMDDFGTGYSSLSNLRAFPFDRIKIDGSFIQSVDSNQQAAAIVRAILELGRGLNLPILAEGVETAEELDFLTAGFCQEVQGYLLGRPAEIGTFATETRLATAPAGPAVSAAA